LQSAWAEAAGFAIKAISVFSRMNSPHELSIAARGFVGIVADAPEDQREQLLAMGVEAGLDEAELREALQKMANSE
jgi:hypothetical protein